MNITSMETTAEVTVANPQRLEAFRATATLARTSEECSRVRKDALELLQDGEIIVGEYAALFGGHVCHLLTRTTDGRFRSADSAVDANALARCYSLAKHGSMYHIGFLVQALVATFLDRLDDPGSSLHATFEHAKMQGDYVVLFGTGLRNVPAASNLMCDLFVEETNVELAIRDYPTIANVRLPRIAPPCDNYARLSLEERVRISLVQDHVLPEANFYRGNGVHVLFVDDVIVTGATADKVYASAMAHGARSFHALYPVLMDPIVALREPAVEEALNTYAVGARIDDDLLNILAESGHVPVLRTLRLLFSQQNHRHFPEMMRQLGSDRVRKLYRAALSADFNHHLKYAQSLAAARDYLNLQP